MSSSLARAQDAKAIVTAVVRNEQAAAARHDLCVYTSYERSARTGQRLWTERIAETPQGKLRRLLEVDGQPLSADRQQAETARLRAIAANPSAWAAEEARRVSDEKRMQSLLNLLPRAYTFTRAPDANSGMVIAFQPDPAFQPATYEERILHGLSGTLSVNETQYRMTSLNASLAGDVNFGYGLLATVRAGSTLQMERQPQPEGEWKTVSLSVKVNGRIILMKSLAQTQVFAHKDFHLLPSGISVADAVGMLLQ